MINIFTYVLSLIHLKRKYIFYYISIMLKFFLFLFYTSRVPVSNIKSNILPTKIFSSENVEEYINDFERFNATKFNTTNNEKNNKNDAAMIPLKDISLNHDTVRKKIKEYINKQKYTNNPNKKK